jgi:DNA segregation ATPase FtsK/SpoIIIE, S-DNA-T family
MIIEIASSLLMGSIAVYSQIRKKGAGMSDTDKIQKIFTHCGLKGKDGETCRVHRNTRKKWGREIVFQHPLGLCEEDFTKNVQRIEDGLNVKKRNSVSLNDIKKINFKQNPLPQVKVLLNRKADRKTVEMEYDGMVKIKIYNKPMCEYLEYAEMKQNGWKVPLGVDRLGNIVYHDFDSEYYMLVAGAIGGGKSNAANLIISHFLSTQENHVKFTLIDLKAGIEFGGYENCKQVVAYAENAAGTLAALRKVLVEIEETREILKAKGFRNVIEAGIKERHFIVIDEIAELSPEEETAKKAKKDDPPSVKDIKEEIWALINSIARLGRAWGIRIVAATQHPIQECVPKYLKRNCEGRLCFPVEDDVASRVILGASGAEHLPDINGRALYKKGAKMLQIQTYRILNSMIDEVIERNTIIKQREEVKIDEPKERADLDPVEDIGLSDT